MADFDMPGLGRARMGLTELARSPAKRGGCNAVKYELVKELYSEIRAARLAGHSWLVIKNSIRSNVNVLISEKALAEFFAEIDKRYEAETGVKALPETGAKRKRGRPRKAVSAPDSGQ
ncbi:hypothetical protein [Cloacibacillus sp. An23]|uniref:hypothetical protein n=1 Tax=Cloacibacillus sp. An23 TaxID=1965591 RepID=UPI000B3987D7|nr:hypothetical protein [Cloacibacillus sp. An23]OUO94719.1 hypothetical protein B5F39_02295 [Cloacibacillus sp. An23]